MAETLISTILSGVVLGALYALMASGLSPVSYTHLTLPTIYSV